MNVGLLKQIKTAILREPRQFLMGDWARKVAYADAKNGGTWWCGTAGCIAGHAAICDLMHKDPKADFQRDFVYIGSDHAARLLCITEVQANRLFFVPQWPPQFKEQWYGVTEGTCAAAKVAAKRIQHFIDTEGRE